MRVASGSLWHADLRGSRAQERDVEFQGDGDDGVERHEPRRLLGRGAPASSLFRSIMTSESAPGPATHAGLGRARWQMSPGASQGMQGYGGGGSAGSDDGDDDDDGDDTHDWYDHNESQRRQP